MKSKNEDSVSRLVFGLLLLVVGALFLLRRYHDFDLGALLRLWPVALLVIGLVRLARANSAWRAGGALAWLGVGGWLLLGNLGLLRASPLELWPLVFVLVGWRVAATTRGTSGRRVRSMAFMGANEQRVNGASLETGEAVAVMGACVLDFSSAHTTSGRLEIETLAFWGGIELIVPRGWAVEIQALPVLGGFEDKTEPLAATEATLVVRGIAVMGGVEIRNPMA